MILSSSIHSPLSRAVLLLLVLAMAIATSGPANATGSEESRISQTREELERVRGELNAARGEADDDMIALEDADAQLEAVFTAVETAQQAVGRQEDAVAEAERELAVAQGELVEQQQRMALRINRLYRQARPDPLITVLDASTVSDAVEQSAYITAIGRQDRALVEGLENAQSRVEGRQRALDEETVALDRVLVEQQALLVEVEEIRNDRELIAAASQDLVARLQSREEHLEEEAIELLRQQAQAEARAVAEAAAKEAAEQLAAEVVADDETPYFWVLLQPSDAKAHRHLLEVVFPSPEEVGHVDREDLITWWEDEMATRLSKQDGSVSGPVSGRVEVLRDGRGIPHILGSSLTDLMFGHGFALGQDRLWQLDYYRRRAYGRLSEVLGSSGLESDKTARIVDLGGTAKRLVDRLPEETLGLLDAFSGGINTALDRAESLPIEFDLLDHSPEPNRNTRGQVETLHHSRGNV